MNPSDFCAEYLKAQGVIILPEKRKVSGPIQDKEDGNVPKVNQYERGDLP